MITTEKKSLRVGKYVDKEHVDAVVSTYKKERWVHNSKRIGKEDSLSAWFSAEELEEYLAMIKQYGADGVKFYFGVYPEDHAPKPEYVGRQTIVLVATKSRQTENGLYNKDLYVNRNGVNITLSLNMPNICPPLCGGFGFTSNDVGDKGITIIDKGDEGLSVI